MTTRRDVVEAGQPGAAFDLLENEPQAAGGQDGPSRGLLAGGRPHGIREPPLGLQLLCLRLLPPGRPALCGVEVGVGDQLERHCLTTGAGRSMYPRRFNPLIAALGRGRQINLRHDEAVCGPLFYDE